jgi:polyhydroxyalkanoate synthesis regulator phasin
VAILESLARLLAHGSESVRDGARAEAQRVLDVLVERGDLSRAEAERMEDAVESAARGLDEQVLAPLGRALRPGGAVADRLAAIEERLARIEAALANRERSGC